MATPASRPDGIGAVRARTRNAVRRAAGRTRAERSRPSPRHGESPAETLTPLPGGEGNESRWNRELALRAFVPCSPSLPRCLDALMPRCLDALMPSSQTPGPRHRRTCDFAKPQVRLPAKKGRCASPAKREDIRAPRFPSPSWLIHHGSSLPSPLRSLCLWVESLPCAHVRGAEPFTSAQNSQKKTRLASRQTAFCAPIYQMHLPSARTRDRYSLHRRSCCSMRTSSILTRQISGGGGRGVCGARKLIPMPLRILRAPGRPTLICVRQSTIGRIVVLVFPGGRGVCGARNLIPMPQKISCAPPGIEPRWVGGDRLSTSRLLPATTAGGGGR